MKWFPCEYCDVYNPIGSPRCYNCGEPFENVEEVDVMGLEEFSKKVWDIEKLSPKKIQQLMKQPIIEDRDFKSKDGKWIVHETRIISIKPRLYFEKVLGVK